MTIAAANATFIVGTAVIVIGLAVWITVFFRRAMRFNSQSDSRLATDLASLTPPPAGETPQVPASATGSSIAWDSLPWDEPQVPAKPVIAPAEGSIESRLAELGDLHERGLITDEELAAARAKVLAD